MLTCHAELRGKMYCDTIVISDGILWRVNLEIGEQQQPTQDNQIGLEQNNIKYIRCIFEEHFRPWCVYYLINRFLKKCVGDNYILGVYTLSPILRDRTAPGTRNVSL